MKKTRRPIGAPSRVVEIDIGRATLTVGPERRPFALTWTNTWLDLGAATVMRRSPWSSCLWCGDPYDGRQRCWRCGHKHRDSVAPTRWWEEHDADTADWNEHRRVMVEAAFEDDERRRGYSCEA